MDGNTTNVKRRLNASAPSAAPKESDGVDRSSSDMARWNDQSNDDGRSKLNEPKLHGQANRFARGEGNSTSRTKQACEKIGKLRVLDVVVFVGVAAKLASILYHRSDPTVLNGSQNKEVESLSDKWSPPKWVKKWMEHKMPFHSPILYRREDDGFFHDSHPDDDEDAHGKERGNIRIKGMLFPREHYEGHEEQVNSHGYAIVDDVLWHIDEYREWTEDALPYSEFQLNDPDQVDSMDRAIPAFEYGNREEDHRHYITDDDAGFHSYYATDDDLIRGTYAGTRMTDIEEDDDEESGDSSSDSNDSDICSVTTFFREYFPNCNEMHAEVSGYQWLIGEEIYSRRWKKKKHLSSERSHLNAYLGHGFYRDAFMFQPLFVLDAGEEKMASQRDEVVFKTMRHMTKVDTETAEHTDDYIEELGLGWDPEDKYTFMQYKEYMRMDAMLLELLTSSPRAANIYSHCAMSSMIEYAPGDIEKHILPTAGATPKTILRRGVRHESELETPINNHISPEEKLETALEMAKCIAEMHGFKDGPIAHVDIQIGQFFRGRDGFIKLVDYNRAEPLLYNEEKEEYCKWQNGQQADGTYRAPEENVDAPLTEKMDVYSLGNVFYALLTGKLVWENYKYDVVTYRIIEGDTMEIPEFYSKSTNPHTRSLAITIEYCWTTDPEERPSIFQVVELLEEAR